MKLNRETYKDKVLGCWMGKNIGGTLGAPMEGQTDLFNVDFYTQKLTGEPLPNDDLDLQLVWLNAVEDFGLPWLTTDVMQQMWLANIPGHWNEYGVAKYNMMAGLPPPLSGACNNDSWKWSNGAWIRAEIWACLFPGDPDRACSFAWLDACCDHTGEGIYAELFMAALESTAFVESDVEKIIAAGLAHIPAESRVAANVRSVLDSYKAGKSWLDVRNDIVKHDEDLGWFQAPANVAFAVIGLVFGEGDLGKTVCTAVNCGDDTDCTAASAGAIIGIIKGRKALPEEWCKPIGNSIRTVAINAISTRVPKTLDELAERVLACKQRAEREYPGTMELTDGPAESVEIDYSVTSSEAQALMERSSFELTEIYSFGKIRVQYETSPEMETGKSQKITIYAYSLYHLDPVLKVRWHLPDGWHVSPHKECNMLMKRFCQTCLEMTLTAGEFPEPVINAFLELQIYGINTPYMLRVPFQCKGAAPGDRGIKFLGHIRMR